MSGSVFYQGGKFRSDRAAEDFAKRNNIDPRDIRMRPSGAGVGAEIRRSSLDRRDLRDSGEDRREGWSYTCNNQG